MPKIKRFTGLDTKRNHAIGELLSLAMDHAGATKRLREILDNCREMGHATPDSLMQQARDIQTQRENLEFAMTGVAIDMAKYGIGGYGTSMVEQAIEMGKEMMRWKP